MTDKSQTRHPFLDDLAPDAELESTVLRRAVKGRENITRLVNAVGSLYRTQTPVFLQRFGPRSVLQYDAILVNGLALRGTAVIEHSPDGSIPKVSVTFSPLGSAISLAAKLGALLDQELGEDLFL